jgi:hypothetical protein
MFDWIVRKEKTIFEPVQHVTHDPDLIHEAFDALQSQTQRTFVPIVQVGRTRDRLLDAVVSLMWDQQRLIYHVEVKPTLTIAAIGRVAEQFGRTQHPALLVTKIVTPPMAAKLRELNIQFIDTAGNAYLNAPGVYLLIQGNKTMEPVGAKAQKGIFTTAGTKVIFALLCNPELVNTTYRDIAKAADVGLETVSRILTGMLRQGFLMDIGSRGRLLRNRGQLLERWVVAYAEQLRPKQLIGTYRAGSVIDWKGCEIPTPEALWGGEVAAAKLTGYPTPEIMTIYLHRPTQEVMKEFQLARQPQGKVELREIFWDFPLQQTIPALVPPLLVYADLIATADPRNIDTAKRIYDEFLQGYFREE